MSKKINPKAFDCEQCGNQIFKSSVRDAVKCCYCGYINKIGRFISRREKNGEYKN